MDRSKSAGRSRGRKLPSGKVKVTHWVDLWELEAYCSQKGHGLDLATIRRQVTCGNCKKKLRGG